MLKVLSNILCDLDHKVKVIQVGQKGGICDGVPSTSALVYVWHDGRYRSKVLLQAILSLGCDATKLVIVVSDKVRLKPVSSATETS